MGRNLFFFRQKLEGKSQKAVACLGGHACAEDFMVRKTAAAVVVVIHGRKVVVDKGIGVHAFQSAGGVHIPAAVYTQNVQHRKEKEGADSLAPCQEAVVHGVVEGLVLHPVRL